MQLVNAICAPTDRSMPPEITMAAWAIAANASGSAAMTSDWKSNEL